MKKHIKLIVQFKFVWGLFFTASILLYSFISMVFGHTSMDFILIWQFVFMTLILTLFHYIIFGEFILASLASKIKLTIHFIICYITLLLFSNTVNWINILEGSSFLIFTLIYTFLYLAICFSLYMYYKLTGERLNNKLAVYKQRKNYEGVKK